MVDGWRAGYPIGAISDQLDSIYSHVFPRVTGRVGRYALMGGLFVYGSSVSLRVKQESSMMMMMMFL